MKILFVGYLHTYGRGYMRYRTLVRMGHEVVALPLELISNAPIRMSVMSLVDRIMWKIGFPIDRARVNIKIREAIAEGVYDIVWVEKGNTIYPSTLRYVRRQLPTAQLIMLAEDDMYALHNRSWYYAFGLKEYDVVFTTKTYNIHELKRLGARKTELFLDAYDETLHRPLELSREDFDRLRSDVCFVGTFERERAQAMLFLARHGIRVIVWGNGWGAWCNRHPNLVIKNSPIFEEEYVRVMNAAKIVLCFLRKLNRDQVTNRSAEIPACGAFMLAERTERHQQMFEENKEAVFFSSHQELLDKVRYYLAHPEERVAIAASGRRRCESSGYSMRAQLASVLDRATQ